MQTHTRYSLNIASTLVADGIHQVHFTGGGRSEGFGGKRRTEMNYKYYHYISHTTLVIRMIYTWSILLTSSRNLAGLYL